MTDCTFAVAFRVLGIVCTGSASELESIYKRKKKLTVCTCIGHQWPFVCSRLSSGCLASYVWGSASKLRSKYLVKRNKKRKKKKTLTSRSYRLTVIGAAVNGTGGLVIIVICRGWGDNGWSSSMAAIRTGMTMKMAEVASWWRGLLTWHTTC